MSWKEWFFAHTDKFILLVMWIIALIFIRNMIYSSPPVAPENLGWARELASGILGAILGLITGATLARRSEPPPPPKS